MPDGRRAPTGIPTVALRFFNVYGPRQALSNPYTGVLAIFASRLLNDARADDLRGRLQQRDFVSVHDVARACRAGAARRPRGRRRGRSTSAAASRTPCARSPARLARVLGKEHIAARDHRQVPRRRHPPLLRRHRPGAQRARLSARRSRSTTGMTELAEWLEGQVAVDRVDAGQRRARRTRGLDAYDRCGDRTDADHRRRRLRRHQPRRPAARRRAAGPSSSTTSRAPASSGTCAGCARRTATACEVVDRRRPRRRRGDACGRRRRSQVFHFAAQVAVTTSLDDPRDDFEINAAARSNVLEAVRAQADAAAAAVHVDEQGLRRPRPTSRSRRDGQRYEPRRSPRSRRRHLRGAAARLPQPVRLLQGRGRPVRARLRAHLRPADRGVPHELHLRPAPVRHRGPGLGRALPAAALRGRADHALRRRHAGARRPVRRRPGRRVPARRAQHRPSSPASAFNIGGGPAQHDQPARAARPHRGAASARRPTCRSTTGAPATSATTCRDTRALPAGHRVAADASDAAEGIERLHRLARGRAAARRRRWRSRASARRQPRAADRGAAHARVRPRRAAAGRDRSRVAAPEPGAGRGALRLEGCGVCASNLPLWEGREWFDYPQPPGAPGHEGWGVVDAVGDGVDGAARSATASPRSPIARTPSTTSPRPTRSCALPAALAGKPFPGEPLGCAMNIFRRSDIEAGQTVAIVGIGFLGALLTRLATDAGARVIAISRRPFVARPRAPHGRRRDDRRWTTTSGIIERGEAS